MKHPDRLTRSVSSGGYTIFYCEQRIGGGGAYPTRQRPLAVRQYEAAMYGRMADDTIKALQAGGGPPSMCVEIDLIDAKLDTTQPTKEENPQ